MVVRIAVAEIELQTALHWLINHFGCWSNSVTICKWRKQQPWLQPPYKYVGMPIRKCCHCRRPPTQQINNIANLYIFIRSLLLCRVVFIRIFMNNWINARLPLIERTLLNDDYFMDSFPMLLFWRTHFSAACYCHFLVIQRSASTFCCFTFAH